MRPSSAAIDNTALFTCSDITSDASCVSCSMISSSGISVVNNQSPAEQETSHNDRSLSSSSDQSFSVDTTQRSDNTFITTHGMSHDMSDDNVPYHSNSNYLLDLGLRCKGFRMGHINIQGINNRIDQIHLLLGSDKNQIHVLGLSETKLNAFHPDTAFEINGFQAPFRTDRKINSGGGLLVYVKDGVCASRRADLEHDNLECVWLEIKLVKSKPFLIGNIYRPPNLQYSVE